MDSHRPVNGDRAWRHGLEASGKHGFDAGLTVDADLIVQDSNIEETGNELTYTPHVKSTFSLLYTLKTSGTRLEISVRYYGRQYSEMKNRMAQRLDDFVSVDFKATHPFRMNSIAAEWFLTVENLFGIGYQIHFGYPVDVFRLVSGLNLTS